jgi:hypothetical protein
MFSAEGPTDGMTQLCKEMLFKPAQCWWLIPVILATQEAETKKIGVQSQPMQTVLRTLF